MGKEEINAVIKVLKSGMIAQGKVVEEFERQFAKYTGTKYAVAVSNGTCALDLALKASGAFASSVLTSPFSFVSSATVIEMNSCNLFFSDIDEKSYNLNPDKINQDVDIIIPVHLFGNPSDMEKIMKIAKNKTIIEDACQAPGAMIGKKKVGSFGDMGCFSFYAGKNITTGEGGMVTTNDEFLAKELKLLRNHGQKEKHNHIMLGYNYRMTDIQAAIGIEQLKKIEFFTKRRIENANYLSEHLKGFVDVPEVRLNTRHVFHRYEIKVNPKEREQLLKKLNKNGIGAVPCYPKPIYRQRLFMDHYFEKLPIVERICKSLIQLPIHPYLTRKDLNKMIKVIRG